MSTTTYIPFSHGARVVGEERNGSDEPHDVYGTVIDGPFDGPGETFYWLVRWDGTTFSQYVFESEMRVMRPTPPRAAADAGSERSAS